MAQCQACERDHFMHTWDSPYEFCPHCGAMLEVAPVEGTEEWALNALRDKRGVEAEDTVARHGYHPICLHDGCICWATPHHPSVAHWAPRKYRLKPTPPEPEIVEWERFDAPYDLMLRFGPHKDNTWSSHQVQSMKDFVNFTILMPRHGSIKVDPDHVWWSPDTLEWSYYHETHEQGMPGFTQRIDAQWANMLRRD